MSATNTTTSLHEPETIGKAPYIDVNSQATSLRQHSPMPGQKRPGGPPHQRSIRTEDSFTEPRDIERHSKLPYFLRMHGSITPRMIVPLAVIGAWATLITCISKFVHPLVVSDLLLTVLGFVVGLGISFRTSSAYERYVDGRKYWAQLSQTSRDLARHIWIHVKERHDTDPEQGKADLLGKLTALNLIVAFAVALKHRLRFEPYTQYEDLEPLVSHLSTFAGEAFDPNTSEPRRKTSWKRGGEYLGLTFAESNPRKVIKRSKKNLGNLPLEILTYMSAYMDSVSETGQFPNGVQQSMVMANLASLNEVLAGTERVLNTPLPIAYSIAISQITWVYVIMLPFQLWHALGWITIPGTIVGAYIILGIAAIGREIENPFGRDENDLPLDKFCQGLEDEINVIASKAPPKLGDFVMTETNTIMFDSNYTSLAAKILQSIRCGSAEPVGGVARFQTLRNFYADNARFKGQTELFTLFSGDAFNPSLESSVTKGAHMVPVLNNLIGGNGKGVACVGNHDLDFGVLQFRHLKAQCTFPWLLANVLDPALGEDVALGNCEKTMILHTTNGIKIGVIGLAEREWLDTINALPPNLIYKSAFESAKALIPNLRQQGADIIIALTHAREPSDVKLAEKTPPGFIDIILGGHDHFYNHQIVKGTHILRSGTDFKQLSYIEAYRNSNPSSPSLSNSSTPPLRPRWSFRITRHDITRSIPEDPSTMKVVENLTSKLRRHLETPVGYTYAPLDARFNTVRTRESNIGNFVCDLMRHYYSAECALMAGGTVRGDQVYGPGVLRLKDIMNCFPFEDPVIVVRVKGNMIREALENSVCLVPALEGRYCQVSGMRFCYDDTKEAGQRVRWVEVAGGPLDEERKYTVATRGYMGRGKDGFTSLLVRSEGGEAEELVSEENGVLISMILRQYFMSLKVMRRWRRWGPSLGRHWGGVHEKLHGDEGSVDVAEPGSKAHKHHNDGGHGDGGDDTDDDGEGHGVSDGAVEEGEEEERRTYVARSVARRWMRAAGIDHGGVGTVENHDTSEDGLLPDWTRGIAPRVEGRIVIQGANGEAEENGN
ncbi:MAG: hypothetical protein L6R39_005167 [Caloplaca ligustica]|nr:MAG: hypothetical protein L6R39_005167 [Caloplaca ligustica]